jgi:transketolase
MRAGKSEGGSGFRGDPGKGPPRRAVDAFAFWRQRKRDFTTRPRALSGGPLLTGIIPAMTVSETTLANAIRALSMDAVEAANSGHPGMPMGMADVATVLFRDYLKFDPAAPKWADRDRFVLSAGHGSMLIYSLLHLTGYARPTIEDIRNFRQLSSPCAGHPENFELAGVEATTGPLGSGLATAVGMAIAERHQIGRAHV